MCARPLLLDGSRTDTCTVHATRYRDDADIIVRIYAKVARASLDVDINFQMAGSIDDSDDNNIWYLIWNGAAYDLRSRCPRCTYTISFGAAMWCWCCDSRRLLCAHLFICSRVNFIRIFQCEVHLHKIKFSYLFFFPQTRVQTVI